MSGVAFNHATFDQPSHGAEGPGLMHRLSALLTRNAAASAAAMTDRYLNRNPVGGGINWLGDGTHQG